MDLSLFKKKSVNITGSYFSNVCNKDHKDEEKDKSQNDLEKCNKPHQEDKLLSDLDINPETEIISSHLYDVKTLFQKGGPTKIKYYMDFVPLKLGVKVNTDQKHYTDEAVDHYKKRAMDLMTETLAHNYHEQRQKDLENNRRVNAEKTATDIARESK